MSFALPLLGDDERPPPRTRGDCIDAWAGIRPTPACVSCRQWIRDSGVCVLDLTAKRGALTLEEVGDVFGVSRERIRQIEAAALKTLRALAEERGLRLADLLPVGGGDADMAGDEGANREPG